MAGKRLEDSIGLEIGQLECDFPDDLSLSFSRRDQAYNWRAQLAQDQLLVFVSLSVPE